MSNPKSSSEKANAHSKPLKHSKSSSKSQKAGLIPEKYASIKNDRKDAKEASKSDVSGCYLLIAIPLYTYFYLFIITNTCTGTRKKAPKLHCPNNLDSGNDLWIFRHSCCRSHMDYRPCCAHPNLGFQGSYQFGC